MRKNLHLGLLVPLLLVVLLASSAFPAGVRADDVTTPLPDGTTVNTAVALGSEPSPTPQATPDSPTADSSPTDAPPAATPEAPTADISPTDSALTPAATLGAPTTDTSPTDPALTPAATQEGAVTEAAGTPVVVLDSDGNEVPLASNEAAQIMAGSDPIWCPEGYFPGDAECTPAAATITALIADLASMSGAGTIYFTAIYATSDATFDGNDPSLANLTDLTIQGGWNGLTGTDFALSGTTALSGTLSIVNWNGDVTLNDLVLGNTGSDGVYVTTSGNIELNAVQSGGNSGRGAYLDNTSGGSAADVTVNSSSFHDNLTGLEIYTYGDISLAYVDASYNTGAGAIMDGAANVSVSQSDFSWNGLDGLSIDASVDVSLSNVNARLNGGDGAGILSGGDLTIDTSTFDLNTGSGLEADAGNMLSLENVEASQNAASGLLLYAGRDVTLTDVAASQNGDEGASVWADWNILVESSIFEDNGQNGTYLNSLNGDITVDCTSFNNNGDYGVNAVLPGALDLSGDTFADNGAGDYTVTGGGSASVGSSANCPPGSGEQNITPTATPTSLLSMNIVYVQDGQIVTLNCTSFTGTVLVLPNGDQVIVPCPFTGQASLSWVGLQDLPGPLPSDLTFLSGMDAEVTPELNVIMTVDFVVPLNQDVAGLSVLRWDDTEWVNLGGIRSAEGFFEARSSRDGVFVLATK